MSFDESRLLINRRKFLADRSAVMAAIASTGLIGSSRPAWGRSEATETVEVKTNYGRLRGKRNGDVITFKGVPYTGSVSGEIASKLRHLLSLGLEFARH